MQPILMRTYMQWLLFVCSLTTSKGAMDATEPPPAAKESFNSNFNLGRTAARQTVSFVKGVAVTLSFFLFSICHCFLVEAYHTCPTSGNHLLNLIQGIFRSGTFLKTRWIWLYKLLAFPTISPIILYAFINKSLDPSRSFFGDDPHFFSLPSFICFGSIILTCRLMGAYFAYAQSIKRSLNKKTVACWLKKLKALDYNALLKRAPHQIKKIGCQLMLWGAAFLLGMLGILSPIFILDTHTYYKKYQRGADLLEEELKIYNKNLPILKEMKRSLRIKRLIKDANKQSGFALSDLPPQLSSDRFTEEKRCINCEIINKNCFKFKKDTYNWSVCRYCYRVNYENRVNEETQKLIQHIEKEHTDKSDYKPSFNFQSICCACSIKDDYEKKACFGSKKKGLYPICLACYTQAKIYPQHTLSSAYVGLGIFFEKIISANSNDVTRQPQIPFCLNSENILASHSNTEVVPYNQLDHCLTCQDLYDLGAPKAVREAYREKAAYHLRVSIDECFICGNKHHKTATCSHKEAVLKQLARRYARYAENGEEDFYVVYGFKQLVSLLYRLYKIIAGIHVDTQSSNFIRNRYYNYLKIEQPCPWCGYLTDKDDHCDHIASCVNCQKEWYFFSGKTVRETSYSHPFVPRSYRLAEGITPYKESGLWSSRHYSINLPPMDKI